jgi:hypothetical protein
MSDDVSNEHQHLRVDLAGYVLGGLTLDEQHAIEAHLAGCADCRSELAELEPVPVLLDLGDPRLAALAAPTAPPAYQPDTRVPTPAARGADPVDTGAPVRPGPARPRRRVIGLAVAALAVAAALVAGVMIGRPNPPSFSTPIALQPIVEDAGAGGSGPSGTAALRATATGTVVRLDLNGLPAGDGTYFECVWASNQHTQSAGTFRAAVDGSVRVDLLTAARQYPGWTLVIVAHRSGDPVGQAVLHADA